MRYRGSNAKPPLWNSTAGRGTIDRQPEVDPHDGTDDTGDTDDPASTAAAGGTGHPERPHDGTCSTCKIEVDGSAGDHDGATWHPAG